MVAGNYQNTHWKLKFLNMYHTDKYQYQFNAVIRDKRNQFFVVNNFKI